jgi:hypothetical protein
MKTIKTAYKQLTFMFAALSLLAVSCKSASEKENTSDSTNRQSKKGKISKRTQDGCYMYVSGNQMKDTLYVQLHVQNNKVSGKMIDDIYEKDSRKGTIAGTMKADNTINAVWTFMQEGMTDTMTVDFRLNHSALFKKPFKADMSTGRQVTDAAANYTIELKPTDCNKE